MQGLVSVNPVLRSRALGGFAVGHAAGRHIDAMLPECLAQLEDAPVGATLGVVYLSTDLIDQFEPLIEKLYRAFPRVNWVGATVDGLMADCVEYRNGGSLAIMVGDVAVDQFRILAGARRSLAGRLASLHGWRQRNGLSGALIHGDASNPGGLDMVDELSRYIGDAPLVGGLIGRRRPGLQLAVNVISGGVSGVVFGRDVDVFSGRALGCSPLGSTHAVTRMAGGDIRELNGRPALDVLFDEAGELLSRDLDRLTSFICPALATETGGEDFAPADFLSIDPVTRSFRVDERIALSGRLRFYRRDGDAAWRHFDTLLCQAVERTRGRTIRAGVYIGGRVSNSAPGTELASIRAALGQFPLIGYRADCDIHAGRRYSHTSVLTLLID